MKEAAAVLVRDDPDMAGHTAESIQRLLRQFVLEGGRLEVRDEKRIEYLDPDDPYWYRARIEVTGLLRPLFVEVKMLDPDPDCPFVKIVSAHF